MPMVLFIIYSGLFGITQRPSVHGAATKVSQHNPLGLAQRAKRDDVDDYAAGDLDDHRHHDGHLSGGAAKYSRTGV